MEDLRALFIGVLGGLVTYCVVGFVKRYSKKSALLDIELLEAEKKHLGLVEGSELEMIRSSFRSLFLLLTLLGVACVSPYMLSFVYPAGEHGVNLVLSVIFWSVFTGASIKVFLRHNDLSNYEIAIDRIDRKLTKMKGNLADK